MRLKAKFLTHLAGVQIQGFQRLLNAAGQQKQGQQVFEIHDHRP